MNYEVVEHPRGGAAFQGADFQDVHFLSAHGIGELLPFCANVFIESWVLERESAPVEALDDWLASDKSYWLSELSP